MGDDKVTTTYKHAKQGDASLQRDGKDWRDGLQYFVSRSDEDAIKRIREHAPLVVSILRAVYDCTEALPREEVRDLVRRSDGEAEMRVREDAPSVLNVLRTIYDHFEGGPRDLPLAADEAVKRIAQVFKQVDDGERFPLLLEVIEDQAKQHHYPRALFLSDLRDGIERIAGEDDDGAGDP